jgi:hypothetical protein
MRSASYPDTCPEISRLWPIRDNIVKEKILMSKESAMALTIEELRSATAALNVVANRLTELFGAEVSVGNAPADMTLEEVRAALAEISRKGYTAEIRSLLQKYGTDRLSELNPAHYRALLAEAEELAHAT